MLLLLLACAEPSKPPVNDTDDDSGAAATTPWYADADGDGWGTGEPLEAADPPDGYTSRDGDCDDADAAVHPEATDLCDGVDADCDGAVDEDGAEVVYADADGDGFGAGASTTGCPGAGLSGNADDCDDTDASVFPDAAEAPDGVDQDCDGVTDEGTTAYDDDGDGETELAGDCDDADPARASYLVEICGDALDEDCDGEARPCGLSGERGLDEADALLVGEGGLGDALLGLDLDGDGAGEIVVVAEQAAEAAGAGGAVYTVDGPVYGTVDLVGSSPRVEGEEDRENVGHAVAAGDLDGDGAPDLLVARRSVYEDLALFSGPVASVVPYGDAGARVTWDGDDGILQSLALGDGDADGFDDVLVGYREGVSTTFALAPGPLVEDFDLGDAPWTYAHEYLAGATLGDADGDGFDDLVVGISDYPTLPLGGGWTTGEWPGVAYVVLGPLAGSAGIEDADAVFYASDYEDALGGGSVGPDLDGDGEDDLVLSAGSGGNYDGGAVYVVPWPGAGPVVASEVATAVVVAEWGLGDVAYDGDLDGDGQADLALGAPYDGTEGVVGVFHGPLGGLHEIAGADARLLGVDGARRFGSSVAILADMNGDGADELLAGDPEASGDYDGGVVGLFYGGGR